MFVAMEFSQEKSDLADFSAYLDRLRFPHRLSEQDGKIVLWVYEQGHVPIAQELYERFRYFPPVISLKDQMPHPGWQVPTQRNLWHYHRITLLLLLGCIAGFLVVVFQKVEWLSVLSFQGMQIVNGNLLANPPELVRQQWIDGHWWRLLTPVFLHFDLMHVVFNATILWFLGSQVERHEGAARYGLLIVAVALVSNLVQYLYSPHNLFGGMSGVNYGLLSYCAVVNYRYANPVFLLPSGFFWISVLMMVLGFLGVFSLFGYAIANWAHLAGFVAGVLAVPLCHRKSFGLN